MDLNCLVYMIFQQFSAPFPNCNQKILLYNLHKYKCTTSFNFIYGYLQKIVINLQFIDLGTLKEFLDFYFLLNEIFLYASFHKMHIIYHAIHRQNKLTLVFCFYVWKLLATLPANFLQ